MNKIPPKGMPVVLACLRLQAGISSDVDVNSKADPKSETWLSCQKMMKHPRKFVKECIEIFDKIGKDACLDRHIKEVKNTLKPDDLDLNQLKHASIALYVLGGWLQAVIDLGTK